MYLGTSLSIPKSNCIPFWSAWYLNKSITCFTNSKRLTSSILSSNLPDSILEKSNTSLTICINEVADSLTVPMYSN